QAADVRLFGGVIRRQVELVIGGRERSRLLDLGSDNCTEPIEPAGADVTRHGQETVLEVTLARPLSPRQRASLQYPFVDHREPLLRFARTCTGDRTCSGNPLARHIVAQAAGAFLSRTLYRGAAKARRAPLHNGRSRKGASMDTAIKAEWYDLDET